MYLSSVIGILDNPTFEFKATVFSLHTVTKPNLSEFVVEEDGNIEGEGWDREVRERNLSGSQANVKRWNIAENGDKSGLEEETKVTELVDHTLLRK